MALPYPFSDAEPAAVPLPSREIRQPAEYPHALGPDGPPIARVAPGETVAIRTVDCFGDRLVSEEQRPSETVGPRLNPVTGPIEIVGAEPGDTLAVRIEAIEATRDWAVSCLLPGCGIAAAAADGSVPERVWRYRRTARGFAWRDRWEIPWAPFFGTIGVAPAGKAVSSEVPGVHGGNLDVPAVAPGNTLLLPISRPGARFFVGDAHAAQGDGEIGGPALEIAARGVFTFDLIKGVQIGGPRIEAPRELMAVGCGRTMDGAARAACSELVDWMARDHGFDRLDAVQLLTMVGGLRSASMVNREQTVVASCPTRYLGSGRAVTALPAPAVVPPRPAPVPPPSRPVSAWPDDRSAPRPAAAKGGKPWFLG